MAVAAFRPQIQQVLTSKIQTSLQTSLPGVTHAYRSGNVLRAAAGTFAVNTVGGAFASISLPSLIVPFSGMLITALRMTVWGLILSPTNHTLRMVLIPHSLTLLLEGQAYILAALGSYLLGKWWLFPAKAGFPSHTRGYLAGLKANLALYVVIVPILLISAVYEASEVTFVRYLLSK